MNVLSHYNPIPGKLMVERFHTSPEKGHELLHLQDIKLRTNID